MKGKDPRSQEFERKGGCMAGAGGRKQKGGNNVIKVKKIKVIKFTHFNRNIKRVIETRPADRQDSNGTDLLEKVSLPAHLLSGREA